jgi:hypothetical protein
VARHRFSQRDFAKARNKVLSARGSEKCGTAPNGTRVCLSEAKIPGMKCGLNKKLDLYACAAGRGKARRRGKRR